jgi:hypothetical protein
MSSRIVPVTLDRPRLLKFSFNEIADMQDKDPAIFLKYGGSMPVLRLTLWAGLKEEDPTITVSKAGDLIEAYIENGGSYKDLVKKVEDALNGSSFMQGMKKQADTTVPEEVDPSKNSVDTGTSP